MPRRLRIAVAGLRFGGAFPAIYQNHPDVDDVSLCDSDSEVLTSVGDRFGIERRFTRVEDVIAAPDIDAVHLVTPIHSHAALSLAVLDAGKHCACTVLMGTTFAELSALVEAEARSKRNYMMMETAVYTYHYLHAQKMRDEGKIGRIQFLRGAHYQDMEHWPSYWKGLPPMHYAPHAVAPLLALSKSRATRVHCLGSGTMRPELQAQYHNPHPLETAIFQLDRENLAAEVTRSLFQTAHEYAELFTVYGERATFEWQMEQESPVVYRRGEANTGGIGPLSKERIIPSDFSYLLPEPLRQFSEHVVVADPQNPHQSILQGGRHHGSHPHMAHEFVRSILEERRAAIDSVTAAHWSAAGICAHESALRGGEGLDVPSYA